MASTLAPVPIPADLPQTAAATTADHPWPLRLLSAKIGEYVSKMSRMWVEGEVTSIKRRPNAKVQYFQLADLDAKPQLTITVKMWSHALPAAISEGMHVVLLVKPDFYQGNGSLTLFADEIRQCGVGDILAKLEALKAKLAAEGLFATAHKKSLPFLPRTIGLICGRNTEAEKDVVVNAKLRWPDVHFDIRQVQVQGPGSVPAMIAALTELDAEPDVDIIVFARGGGSPEDLLPFSDEALIRAVFAARTPTVSAIGHEADSPILDFVADLRASTPTDAARRIVPDVSEERRNLDVDIARGRRVLTTKLQMAAAELAQLQARPGLAHPDAAINARSEDVERLAAWGRSQISTLVQREGTKLDADLARLRTLSPFSTLKRGYSILRTSDGALVHSAAQTSKDVRLEALMHDGSISVVVEHVAIHHTGERDGISES